MLVPCSLTILTIAPLLFHPNLPSKHEYIHVVHVCWVPCYASISCYVRWRLWFVDECLPLVNRYSLCGCLPFHSNQQLMSSLVRCLKAVADSYNPAILDTTIPSNLFGSLVKLLAVKDPGKIHCCVFVFPTAWSTSLAGFSCWKMNVAICRAYLGGNVVHACTYV